MDETKKAGTETETTYAAAADNDAGFATGIGTESAAEAKKPAAQDTQEKADAPAAEAAAKADPEEKPAVTGKEPEKPTAAKEKPADEKAKAEESVAKIEALTAKAQKAETALRKSMATTAALMAGIRPDRADKAVLLANVSGLDPMADDAEEKFKAALQAVVDDMPELAAPPAGTGSPGAFARKPETKPDGFVKGLQG